MMQSRQFPSRAVLTTLVAAPLCIMGILSVTVLLPALKDPESRFYSSGIGYPAVQRSLGKPIHVETIPVAARTLGDSVAAPGESVALQQVNVRPLVSGPVEKVYVVEGQWVRRGQPLIQLQRAFLENQVNTARNNVTTAEKNLQALQSLAPENLQKLKENVLTANARLQAAETQLKQIDSLAEQQLKNNVEVARQRLLTTEKKLQQIELLAEQGAIAKFQLYDIQEIYATRKKELLDAQQGAIATQTQQFSNKDFYITSKNELISAQQALEQEKTNVDRDRTNARLTLENNRIALQNATRDLNRTVIYASTDGLVSRVNIHPGEVVDTLVSNTLITLTQDIVFKGYIDQARLNTVKMGDRATVRLVAYPGRTFSGRLIRLNPTVETDAAQPTSQVGIDQPGQVGINRQYTYSIWVAVDNLQMPPGLQGYVQFDQGKKSLAIPESAVTHFSGGEGMVMVAEAGIAVVKKVNLGRIFDNHREVLQGLKPGEQVVLSPRALNPGDRLEIQSTQVATDRRP